MPTVRLIATFSWTRSRFACIRARRSSRSTTRSMAPIQRFLPSVHRADHGDRTLLEASPIMRPSGQRHRLTPSSRRSRRSERRRSGSVSPGLKRKGVQGRLGVCPDFTKLTREVRSSACLSPQEDPTFLRSMSAGLHRLRESPTDGSSNSTLTSDDGSRSDRWRTRVDNDGLTARPRKLVSSLLAKGFHKIEISWFNKGGASLAARIAGSEACKLATACNSYI